MAPTLNSAQSVKDVDIRYIMGITDAMTGFAPAKIMKVPPVEIELSRRERQILELMCCGFAMKAIAYELERTPATVNGHVSKLCVKARVSRTQLVIFALQNPAIMHRGGRCKPGLHPPGCPCDSPYCSGMRRAA